jgi:RNA polymerase sigma-70 factor (ECF subfamily)
MPDTLLPMAGHESDDTLRFERLYALARDPLARYLARRAAPDAVEDLFAEVMTVAWRRLHDIPRDGELPWLYGVARRTLANHRRANGRFGRLLERVSLVQGGVDPGVPVTAAVDPDLGDALATLTATDAEVLRLWAWEELAPLEIGQALGISANAASIRLHRAKGRLRDALERAGRKTYGIAGHEPGVERKEAR